MRAVLSTLALLLMLTACAPASQRATGPVLPPVFEVLPARTSFNKFNPPGAGSAIRFTIGTRVRNPNDFPVTLERVEFELFFGETSVLEARRNPELSLAAGATESLDFEVRVPLGNDVALIRRVGQALLGVPLPFRLEGAVSLKTPDREQRLGPYILTEGTALARERVVAPQLRLDEDSSEIFLLEPDAPVVRVVIRATNFGDIGYFLYGNDLKLFLGGEAFARGDMTPAPVPAGEVSRTELLFYPEVDALNNGAREALYAALGGIPMSLEVRGDLRMDVLGVGTYDVGNDWEVFGFLSSDAPFEDFLTRERP